MCIRDRGCAAAVAAIHEYKRLKIEENVASQGAVLGELLAELAKKHSCVGEIRQIGLFAAMELVKDESGTPLVSFNDDAKGIMAKIIGMLM